jgi:solute carrier family 25 S-adenosylmethionine transporter 26
MRHFCRCRALFLATSALLLVVQPAAAAAAASLAPRTTTLPDSAQASLPSWAKRLLAGGASRGLAQMTLYPVDALRTLAQTRDGRTLADVGVSALVRGSLTTSMFALGMGSIQFGVFGICREQGIPALWASAVSAASSCLVSVPQEVIKQRLVTNIYPSFRAAVAAIARTEGLRGFYAAWKPTMARNVPFVMTTFTTMDAMQAALLRRRPGQESLTTLETVATGVVAAFIGGVLTNPADVIKTRLMTQAASAQVPYTSALNCLVTVVRTEGVGTLYAGFRPRSIYMCSLWGMTFALNNRFQKAMGVSLPANRKKRPPR